MQLVGDVGILDPVWAGAPAAVALDSRSIALALLRVEREWVDVLVDAGVAPRAAADALARATATIDADELGRIVRDTPLGGNPVIPVVAHLKRRLHDEPEALAVVHRGLTSQDVLDSALQLVAAETIDGHIAPDTRLAGDAAARLAQAHRDTLCVARTLGQPALPTTFGYRAATWLASIDGAHRQLRDARERLAVQLGGAAGTSASLVAGGLDVDDLRGRLAHRLGLIDAGRPWHTDRGGVLRLGAALAEAIAAAGTIASDVVTGSRPELGELAEGLADGAGGSSAMPQKRNPVRSVMLRSAAMQAPGHLATLAAAAGTAVDERPDGAWHAEWPATLSLLRLAAGAAAELRGLLDGLAVDPDRMRANLEAAGDGALSERVVGAFADIAAGGRSALRDALAGAARSGGDLRAATLELLPPHIDGAPAADAVNDAFDPRGYLGQAPELTDRIVAAWRERE